MRSPPAMAEPLDCTDDRLLGGTLRVRQPRRGYRIAVDTVLLGAASGARSGARVIDVGAGVGGAALTAARLTRGTSVMALEREPALAHLLKTNAKANALDDRVMVAVGDLAAAPLPAAAADVVLTNPPYAAAERSTRPSTFIGRRARHEGSLGLAAWLAACVPLVRPGGHLVVVHRADRLDELLAALPRAVQILPLWPRPGAAAKRVLVRARIARGGHPSLLAGLVLHGDDNHFTPAVDAILRGRAAVRWE